MDTSRIFRLTVPGWAFILFTALQSWILGKDVGAIIQGLPTGPANIIVGLAAGPVVGFVISAFANAILNFFLPEFVAPHDEGFQRFQEALRVLVPWRSRPELDAILTTESTGNWRAIRKRDRKLKPFFNLLVHTRAPLTFIEYSTRRWTMYWMYANTITAFLFSTVLSLKVSGAYCERSPDWFLRFPIEIALLLFMGIGIWKIISLHREIRKIAWLWLYHEARC